MPDESPTILAANEECAGERLVSLDALRGIVVLAMVFVNNVMAGPAIPSTFHHSRWNGITFADTIFPAFVFIMGVSLAYSFARSSGLPRSQVARRFLWRVLLLFALGVITNVLFARAVGSETIRIPGVLQRLALASLFAAPFARLRTRWILVAAAAFLAAHALILLYAAPPGVIAGIRTITPPPGSTIAAWFDRLLLGRGVGTGLDPENFLGVLSSTGQVLLGVATGRTLMRYCRENRGVLALVGAAVAAFALGWALTPVIPFNKRLWSASYVLVVSGAVAVVLTAMYYFVDRRGYHFPASLAVPPGRNAIAIFIGSEMLEALMLWIRLPNGMHLYTAAGQALESAFGELPGTMLFAAAHVAVWYAVSWVLASRRIYIKL